MRHAQTVNCLPITCTNTCSANLICQTNGFKKVCIGLVYRRIMSTVPTFVPAPKCNALQDKTTFGSCKRVTETGCAKAACVHLNWAKKIKKEGGRGDRCIQEVYQPFNKGNLCIPFLKLNFISCHTSHTAKDKNFQHQPFNEEQSVHSISRTEFHLISHISYS